MRQILTTFVMLAAAGTAPALEPVASFEVVAPRASAATVAATAPVASFKVQTRGPIGTGADGRYVTTPPAAVHVPPVGVAADRPFTHSGTHNQPARRSTPTTPATPAAGATIQPTSYAAGRAGGDIYTPARAATRGFTSPLIRLSGG